MARRMTAFCVDLLWLVFSSLVLAFVAWTAMSPWFFSHWCQGLTDTPCLDAVRNVEVGIGLAVLAYWAVYLSLPLTFGRRTLGQRLMSNARSHASS